MRKTILFAMLSFLMIGVNTQAQTTQQEKLNVAILIFDGVQIIDYTGPYEVLGSRGKRNVFTVAEKADVVRTNMGMKVVPNYTFKNHPKIDILVLPGGGNILTGTQGKGVGGQLDNEKVIKWIQANAKDAKYVMSVCNGAFFLAKAGLLEGLPATTTAGFISSLQSFSPTIKPVYDKRFVDNGKIITTAGLSSGIDGALHLVEKLDGMGAAKEVAYGIEYNWQPDSDFARANLADMKLPGSIYNAFYSDAQPLDFNGDKNSWEEKWLVKTSSSANELLENINKQWASEANWSKLKSDQSESSWKLTDKDGKTWNGQALIKPADENGKVVLTIKIARDKDKKGE